MSGKKNMNLLKKSEFEKKETILIVHNYYTISGGEDSVVKNEKELLEEKGHRVILYIRDNNEIIEMSKIKVACSFLFSEKTYHEIRSLIKKEKIDIVHVHNTFSLISPSVYYAAQSMNVPVIQTIHNFRLICPNALLYRKNGICEDCLKKGMWCAVKNRCYHDSFFQTLLCVLGIKLHRKTKIYKKIHYICLTEFNSAKLLEGMGESIERKHIYVKPNFVEDIYGRLLKENRSVTGKYCLYVGRVDESKGILEVAEAWKDMKGVPTLIICGTGPETDRLKKIIAGHSNIISIGFISHEKVLNLIFYAEALIFCSKLYEGLPMTIVESMMCGTPVICRNIGNGADIVKRIADDMLYNTKEELYNILKKKNYESYRENFRKEYLRLYSPEVNYRNYWEILDRVKSNGV